MESHHTCTAMGQTLLFLPDTISICRYVSKDLGIIYCQSKKDTEVLAEQLSAEGIAAAHYHADVEPVQRQRTHRAWSEGGSV